jgi:hypothetical protein
LETGIRAIDTTVGVTSVRIGPIRDIVGIIIRAIVVGISWPIRAPAKAKAETQPPSVAISISRIAPIATAPVVATPTVVSTTVISAAAVVTASTAVITTTAVIAPTPAIATTRAKGAAVESSVGTSAAVKAPERMSAAAVKPSSTTALSKGGCRGDNEHDRHGCCENYSDQVCFHLMNLHSAFDKAAIILHPSPRSTSLDHRSRCWKRSRLVDENRLG